MSSGIVPSLLTAGISEDEPQARATSSMTIAVARALRAGAAVLDRVCGAWKSDDRSAS